MTLQRRLLRPQGGAQQRAFKDKDGRERGQSGGFELPGGVWPWPPSAQTPAA